MICKPANPSISNNPMRLPYILFYSIFSKVEQKSSTEQKKPPETMYLRHFRGNNQCSYRPAAQSDKQRFALFVLYGAFMACSLCCRCSYFTTTTFIPIYPIISFYNHGVVHKSCTVSCDLYRRHFSNTVCHFSGQQLLLNQIQTQIHFRSCLRAKGIRQAVFSANFF